MTILTTLLSKLSISKTTRNTLREFPEAIDRATAAVVLGLPDADVRSRLERSFGASAASLVAPLRSTIETLTNA